MSGWHLEEIQKSHTSQGRSQATLAFQCFRRPVGQKAGWLFLNWQNWMKREKNWIPLISWGSLPAPRCYQRTQHMHIHMPMLLYKNLYGCVTIYKCVLYSHFQAQSTWSAHCWGDAKVHELLCSISWNTQMPLADLGEPPRPAATAVCFNTNWHHLCSCQSCKAPNQDCRLLSPSASSHKYPRPKYPRPRKAG